ncbi:hypothetical protein [Amycolatopsis echigonensis]|uniref:Uncharacterized protein n=1 Tax=Amycolatopsis echigonensis TaxID=2576905 RepID=A0A8E1W8E1_9PSEU|nr:hypothetical protein [Amycolatopsis echigonensis]MBB2506021.1 hypothetical protein [Amycolatopsis echigonensis]
MTDYQLDRKPGGTIQITTTVPLEMMQEFLRAHGIDANYVPCPSTVTVSDEHLTVETFVLGKDHRIVVADGEAVRKRRTVELQAPWPPQATYVRKDGDRG